MKTRLVNISLLLLSCLSTLGAVELVIRGFDLFSLQRRAVAEAAEDSAKAAEAADDGDTEELKSSSFWVMHPYRGISPRPNHDPFNNLGILWPGGDPRDLAEEDLVVGVFGGSVAKGLGLDGKVHLERTLKKALGTEQNIHVVNFGVSGYKQPQQIMLLTELLLLGVPIDVVINLDGFNELVLSWANANVPFHPLYPDYSFWVSGLGASTGALSPRQIELQARAQIERRRALQIGGWVTRSRLGGLATVQAMAGGRILQARVDSTLAEQELRTLPIRKLAEDLWHLDDPCLGEGAGCPDLIDRIWRDASIMMARHCRSQGIRYFHVLQPNQYLAGSKKKLHPKELEQAWAPDFPRSKYAAARYPRLRQLGRTLAAEGVDYFDATQIFLDSTDVDYFDTCCHLTHLGNHKLAIEIGTWMGEMLAAEADASPELQGPASPSVGVSRSAGPRSDSP